MSGPKTTINGIDYPGSIRELDAASLAPAAGMHLGLDHPHRPAQRPGGRRGLLRTGRNAARRHGNSVASKDVLRLKLVQIHRAGPCA